MICILQCFNPILEPFNDWPCKFELSPKQRRDGDSLIVNGLLENTPGKVTDELSFPQGHSLYEDEDEVTETKIRDFLDEKVSSIFIFLHIFSTNNKHL